MRKFLSVFDLGRSIPGTTLPMIQQRWLDDDRSARAMRALVGMGAIIVHEAGYTQQWSHESPRPAVLVLVADRAAQDVEVQLRLLRKTFVAGEVDLIVIGGDEAHRAAARAVSEGSVDRAGIAHVNDAGELWIGYAEPGLDRALRAEFDRADAPAVDRGALVEAERELRERVAKAGAEVASFNAQISKQKPWITWGLLAVMIAMFAVQLRFGSESLSTAVRLGAMSREKLKGGELYRLLSYSFLHGGVNHLLMNGLSLFSLGAFYERLLGRGRFATLYVLSALAGALAAALFGKGGVVVGASGAVFGLIGASVALAFKPMGALPAVLVAGFRRNAVVNIALQVMVSLLPNVSMAAHVGGFLVGFVMVYSGLAHPKDTPMEGRDAPMRALGFASLLLLGAATVAGVVHGRVWARSDVSAWQSYPLAPTTLSMRLPRAPHAAPARESRFEWRVAEFAEDGMQAALIYGRYPETPTDDDLEQLARAFIDGTQPVAHPADTSSSGPPRRSTLGGFARIDQSFSASGGVGFRNTLLLRRSGIVSLQVVYRTAERAAAEQTIEAMLLSLTEP
jgi:rhomboid protease GluP